MIIDITEPKDLEIPIWTPENIKWDINALREAILAPINETYSPNINYNIVPELPQLSEAESRYTLIRAKKHIVYSYRGCKCHICGYHAFGYIGIEDHHFDFDNVNNVNFKEFAIKNTSRFAIEPKIKITDPKSFLKFTSINVITKNNSRDNSLWGLLFEVDKTIPICSNCHRLVHTKRNSKRNSYIKDLIVERLNIDHCANCRCKPPISSLEIHHIDKEAKEIELSRVIKRNGKLFLKETKKEPQIICINNWETMPFFRY